MRPRKTIWTSGVILLGLTLLSACSTYTATPEAKTTVLNIVNEYLRLIVQGKVQQVEGMILWIPYTDATGITKETFRANTGWIHNRWPVTDHPLLSLQLIELDVAEDKAVVRLKKVSRPDQPEIVVSLQWIGNAWLIVRDSLFTANGVVPYLKDNALKTNSQLHAGSLQ